MSDVDGYVKVDYFSVNNIKYDVPSPDLDDSYLMVHSIDTETMTEDDQELVSTQSTRSHDNVRGHCQQPDTDDIDSESRSSQQSRSPIASDNSTQLLRLSLSAIHAKMEESLHISSKLQRQQHRVKHLSPVLDPEHVLCHRRCITTYKLILLLCSVATFVTYCYYYHSYFHAMKPSKVSPPRLIQNQYDHFEDADEYEYHYDFEYEYHIDYQYEHYYREHYGYYHDYSPDSRLSEGYSEYNDTMLYCWQLLLVLILFVICFTSFQVFGVDEVPTKHE